MALSDIPSFKEILTDNSASETEIEDHKPEYRNTLTSSTVQNSLVPHNITQVSHIHSFVPQYHSPITAYDFENIIPRFSGKNQRNIITWLQRFENIAESFKISEQQKFILLQLGLKDIARHYIQSELQLFTYDVLKRSILAKFSLEISTAHIHDLLRLRNCQTLETVFQYYITNCAIANRIALDYACLIYCVISGINDTPKQIDALRCT